MKALKSPAAILLVSLTTFIVACGRETPKEEAPRPVLTMRVADAAQASRPAYAGEIRSRIEQTLSFRIAGKVSERLVDAGAFVRPGQVLARLDPVDTTLGAGAAESQRQLAEADAARFRELKARHFVSQAALDSRETQLKSAAAQAELSRNQAAYTTLKADQPGVVGQVLAEVGHVVTPGQAIYRIARADALEVAIAIPESRLTEVRKAGEAEVTLWANDSRRYRGKLREIAAMPDPQTRTYAARVAIADADDAVVFGMSATVRFAPQGAPGSQVSIPQTALFQNDGKPAVWLVEGDDRIALRAVTVSRYADDAIVIDEGLRPGERIVVAGVHKLTNGQQIRAAERNGAAIANGVSQEKAGAVR